MISDAGKLYLVSKEFNWFNNRSVDSKLIQKSIYILQIIGLDTRHFYGWYTTGPYSSDLSKDIFDVSYNIDYYSNEIKNFELSDNAKEVICKFQRIFVFNMYNDLLLEFVASMIFLKKYYPNYSDAKIIRKLKEQKPKFKDRSYDCYFNAALIRVNNVLNVGKHDSNVSKSLV